MRRRCGCAADLSESIVVGSATLLPPTSPASAVCSVFDKHPCTPTVCSVFRRGPCIPEIDYPIGQDLRLTIETAAVTRIPNAQAPRTASTSRSQARHATRHVRRAAGVLGPAAEGRSANRHADVGALCLQAQRRDHRSAARDLYEPGCAAARRERPITTRSRRRSRVARRCHSPRAWAARSPAGRSPSVSSTIGTGRDDMAACRSHRRGAGDRRACDRRGRAGPARAPRQHHQRPRGGAAGVLGSAAARSDRVRACRSPCR